MSKNEHDEWPQGDGESDFDYLLRCLAEHKESHVAWAKHLEHYPPESERAAQALGTAPEQWADAARYDKLIAITGKLIARNVMLVEVVAALSLPAETLEIASCNHVAHVARQARENAALYFQKWTEAISTLPRSSQNQTVASGVEGAHEGTTADKSVALAESSLSSPPQNSDSSAPISPEATGLSIKQAEGRAAKETRNG